MRQKLSREYLERLRAAVDAAEEEDDDDDAEPLEQVFSEYMEDGGAADSLDLLAKFTEHGGYPNEDEDAEFTVNSATIEDGGVIFDCDVLFSEKVHGGGCPDMADFYELNVSMKIRVDRRTGELSVASNDPPSTAIDWSVY
jgi:hypothetical protein